MRSTPPFAGRRVRPTFWWQVATLILAAGVWRPSAIRAQSGLEVLAAPPPAYEFGQTMTFQLLARGEADITAVRLYLAAAGASARQWPDVVFEAGPEVAATAVLDLALFPLPPFAPVEYWWELEDSAGGQLTTPPQSFQYEDNRFAWQRLSDGALTVHWYNGDEAFGRSALTTAAGALPRINRDIRAPLAAQTNIYLYSNPADIQAALQRLGKVWADGHADPALGVVLVVVPNDLRVDFALQREIPHELTHVLLYEAAGGNLRHVPHWLSEGLAVMNQGQPSEDFAALLAAARTSDSFLDLASLCSSFPADSAQARLAYAQSESVVRYVRSRFGSEGVFALIAAYASGADCDLGVRAALGLSLEELSAAWLRDAIFGTNADAAWSDVGPWLLLGGLAAVAPLGFLLFSRKRML